ncbi:thiamine diphosphokinase [Fusobacterium sp.]|uniref:thiamine diphosphokinase n=1 Tax=Fusobacterium sp. TaxID=68766 RepID=UPI002619650D|nr:thiamine diphosphokinase [Fusobacterium sp.]
MNTAFIFLNGIMDSKNPFYKNLLKDEKNIFCADGGLKYALDLNIFPLEVWGDFDSIDSSLLEKAKKNGSKIVSFDKRKDFTDGELIISEISKRNFEKIVVLGGLGGRTDHLLTNLNLLFKFENVFFVDEKETIFKVDYHTEIKNEKGKTISFIPMSDIVEGLTLKGFEYPANNFTVKRGDSLCTSNVVKDNTATVNFNVGKLIGIIENK